MRHDYNIHVMHKYNVSSEIIFNLIQKGVLFKLTGADEINFDFRRGGSFKLIFNNRGEIIGKFIQIIADEKITMQWNVTGFGRSPETNTKVCITISEEEKTIINVKHTEIKSEQSKAAKQRAWSEILDGLEKEIENINK